MKFRENAELRETIEMMNLSMRLKEENTDIFNAVKNIMIDMKKKRVNES